MQTVADESKVVEEQVDKKVTYHSGRDDGDDEYTIAAAFRIDRATRHAFTVEVVCWKVARVTTHYHDDMATMTTPTTKGWRFDASIILLGWSVTLAGPGQHPRYTSAVKVGRPWVAQRLTMPPNTTGTRSTPKLFSPW